MSNGWRWLVGLVLVGILVGPPAQAQTSGDTIREIVIQGNQRIERATVESYLALRRGERFDPAALDTSLKNLFATGLFDDVKLTRDGNRLVVTVVENPIINRIAFEGNKRIDDKILESEVQLRPRVVFTRARVQDAVTRILEIYRRSGRYAARVEPKIVELDQNRVDLIFEIDEGELTTVGGISFIGNASFSDSTLRGVIQTTESAWWRILTSDDTYDADRLQFDQELLRRYYQARGYADFQVVSAVAELTPDGKAFFITFTIDEGPIYKFGKIDVTSSVPDLDARQLQQYVLTGGGAVYNADQVEKTIQQMTDALGALGYAFTQIDPIANKNRQELLVDVRYEVREGPRVYVERIEISGNARTLDSVIRREFRIAEGDAFNTALLRRSRQRIQNLSFFESVDIKTEQGSAADKILIKVRVSEKSTGELSFGAGFSTTDGVLGDIRLRERNLLGRGQDLRANFTISTRRQEAELSFTEPYFLERDIAAGFDIFRSLTDFQSESSFDETITGGTLRMSYPLTEYLRHALRYTLKLDEIHDIDDNASVFILDEEGDRWVSAIGHNFTYDRRDVRFLPSSGYLLRIDQELSGLGGDSRYIKHDGRAEWYYSFVPDLVLNLALTGGYIHGYGGEDVTLSERFFIGGATLRGFKFGGVGPRDSGTDDALGGNAYYVGTAELRFPLGLPKELRIFGRTFIDVGTLTEIDVDGPQLVDNSAPRVAAGVGFSWLSPLGPLSIDFAWALKEEKEDQTESFRLSFGTRF